MRIGMWFQLNVSASDSVRLVISVLQQEDQSMQAMFNSSMSIFTQKVTVGGTGTYQVDIVNENQYEVEISGYVDARENVTKNNVFYPYSTPGTLLALVGIVVLIVGALTKPKRIPKKR